MIKTVIQAQQSSSAGGAKTKGQEAKGHKAGTYGGRGASRGSSECVYVCVLG